MVALMLETVWEEGDDGSPEDYEVEGIPHTVVIDPEGKIAWVHSGFSPDLKQKLFEAIAAVLSR